MWICVYDFDGNWYEDVMASITYTIILFDGWIYLLCLLLVGDALGGVVDGDGG